MTGSLVTLLAADPDTVGYRIGSIFGILLFPTLGLILLIVGLRQRSAAGRQPFPPQPGYPPPPGYGPPGHPGYPPAPGYGPPGFPPPGQHGYPPQPYMPGAPPPGYPQQWGGGYPPVPPPQPKSRGTALIVIGAILLALSLLGILGRAAKSTNSAPTSAVDIPAVQMLW